LITIIPFLTGSIFEIVSIFALASSSVLAKTFLFVIKSTLIFIFFDSVEVNFSNLESLDIASTVFSIISSAREFLISLIFPALPLISQFKNIVTKQLHFVANNSGLIFCNSSIFGTLIFCIKKSTVCLAIFIIFFIKK